MTRTPTVGVAAHLIGQTPEAPLVPEFLWQAGTFENHPLQSCRSRNTTEPPLTLDGLRETLLPHAALLRTFCSQRSQRGQPGCHQSIAEVAGRRVRNKLIHFIGGHNISWDMEKKSALKWKRIKAATTKYVFEAWRYFALRIAWVGVSKHMTGGV